MNKKSNVNVRGEKVWALIISVFFLLFYVSLQSSSIYGGDAGDLVTAAYLHGVSHPPGYPLYTSIGWLLTLLPISSVAWRVTLLSSIPSAIALGLVFLICTQLTKSIISSFIATVALGMTYLYWLYALVPEVFGLLSMFVVLIFYLLLQFAETKNIKWFWFACFAFGLSLTHQHFILFTVFAYAYLAYPILKNTKSKLRLVIVGLILIILGALPYIYVVVAANTDPAINWENPKTVNGFVRLATRAMYGTFRSNQGLGLDPVDRIRSLKIAFDTLLIDATWVGIFLTILGMIAQYKKQRHLFYTIFIAFITTGPLFIYYASFPVLQNFTLATSERFLLVSYIFMYIWMAFGIQHAAWKIDTFLKLVTPHIKITSIYVFIILPLVLGSINYRHLAPLKNDRTAEQLAQDILNSTPDHAILFLFRDTSLFNTQYVYFTLGGRSHWRDIKLVHTGMLGAEFYSGVLTSQYPDMNFATILGDKTKDAVTSIADAYIDTYPILSDDLLPVDTKKYGWIPEGLVYRLYKNILGHEPITKEEYTGRVEKLFASYQDPSQGALKTYTHVMLADVLRVYSNAYFAAGKEFLFAGEFEKSETYLRTALSYVPQSYEIYILLSQAFIGQNKCIDAEKALNTYVDTINSNPQAYEAMVYLYRNCFKDETKAQEYEKKHTEVIKSREGIFNSY